MNKEINSSTSVETDYIEVADYIEKFYKIKQDAEMAEDLKITVGKVRKIRYELGFRRQRQTFHKIEDIPKGMKWCWYCTEFHEKDLFGKNKTRPDGLQDECKKAVKLIKLKREANKNRKPQKIKEKLCVECYETKNISNFIKNVSTIDGYSNLCINCLNKNNINKRFKDMEEK